MGSVHHAAILKASEDKGWGGVVERLLPGAHVVLMGDTPTWQRSSVDARRAGLEVRDSIAILSPAGLSFAVLLRKPLEASVADQLLKTGTGAINIDASRVFTDWNEADRPDSWKKSGHSAKPDAEKIAAPPGTGINCHPKGRWPSNLVFVHGEACVLEGIKKVKNIGGASSGMSAFGQNSGWNKHNNRKTEIQRDRDENGLESVPNWICAPGCPVAALDRQSGQRGGGFGKQYARKEGATWSNTAKNGGGSRLKNDGREFGYGDAGGASRFYKQFKSPDELRAYLVTLILPDNGALLEGFPS